LLVAFAAALGCVAWSALGARETRRGVERGEFAPRASLARPAPQDRRVEAGGRSGAVFAGPFEAQTLRVVDGDTFRARVTVWFGQEIETSVRLRGIDAPERAARCAQEAAGAERATEALAELLQSGRVSLANVSSDKYFGRVVADVVVTAPSGEFPPTDVGQALLAQGVARPYDGRRRGGWCDQRQARLEPRRGD
jgi:endonuclease YncB( thermonuclease family)